MVKASAQHVLSRLARAHRGHAPGNVCPTRGASCDLEGCAAGPPPRNPGLAGSVSKNSCEDQDRGGTCARHACPHPPVGSPGAWTALGPGGDSVWLAGVEAGDTQGRRLLSGLAQAHGVPAARGAEDFAPAGVQLCRPPCLRRARSPASSSQRHRCGAPAAKSQPRPFPPAVGPRSLKAGTRMPSPWGACGPASTSRAVPKETLGSGPAHLGKLQTTSWGRGGGGHQPGADGAAGADAGRGRQSLHSLSFLSKSIKLYETEHNLLARK